MSDAALFDRLKQDHDLHRRLLDQISAAEAAEERKSLLDKFRVEVTAHAAAEEETLYATMLSEPDLRHDAQHSVSEHKEIDDFLEEMADLDPASDAWRETFGKMKHRYTHHIDEEEEDMFPEADKELPDAKLAELGARFEERKPAELDRAEKGVDQGDERD
ncbi:hemerythrin superfamily protein [Sphingomonas jejuensis]|uniref:Hemerythrin superfamily protein n=1 Tax=Sphingomonas jejuensis TaxID=904715 RepID=A0ABX0XR24_9SPHN|nr:hemerythrin domain-containing protein [Sphingomonas jejuensis]NJC35151.1 hemerythrin superfamily protein [Sphingomonas jejuensis]